MSPDEIREGIARLASLVPQAAGSAASDRPLDPARPGVQASGRPPRLERRPDRKGKILTHRVLALLALLVVAAAAAAAATSPARARQSDGQEDRGADEAGDGVEQAGEGAEQAGDDAEEAADRRSTEAIGAVAAVDVCGIAVTADAISGTWAIIDRSRRPGRRTSGSSRC